MQGNIHLYPTLFDINKDNLDRGYFYKNGKIPPHSCVNITQTALNVKQIAWASAFVERHKNIILGDNETQDFYRMSKALCLFSEKKYGQSLEMIPLAPLILVSPFFFYGTQAGTQNLLRIALRSLDHKIDAFKMFISRAVGKCSCQPPRTLYQFRQLRTSTQPIPRSASQKNVHKP